jgi:hypothetical protein
VTAQLSLFAPPETPSDEPQPTVEEPVAASPLPRIPPMLPLDCPTDEEAMASYQDLRDLDPRTVWRRGAWDSRSELPFEVLPFALSNLPVGTKASNRFHYQARMACDSLNSPSVVRSWYNLKFRAGLESSKFYADSPKTALALRKYIPAQYRPAAALAQFKLLNARRVYDPCGGWGDRLAAALAADLEVYYARDVNPVVFAGYSEQVKRLPSKTQVCLEFKGAEIDAPASNYFDLVMTSPPYFKAEKYMGSESSHVLYKAFDQWMEKFLFRMVANAYESLRDGGYLLLNISDVYADHRINKICLPLVDFCRTQLGLQWGGAFGYDLGKRLNSNNASSSKAGFGEPVLVFRKNGDPADFLRRLEVTVL